jgi:hypothetical protein
LHTLGVGELLVEDLLSVDVEQEFLVIPGIDLVELELDAHFIVRR